MLAALSPALPRAGRRAARAVGLGHARGAARARHARPRGSRPAPARLPARPRGLARPGALQRACGRARGGDEARSPEAIVELEGQLAYAGGRLSLVRHPAHRPRPRPALSRRGCAACSTRTCGSSATPTSSGSRARSTCARRSRPGATTSRRSCSRCGARCRRREPAAAGGRALRPQGARAGHARASTTTWPRSARAPTSRCRARPTPPSSLGRAEIERGRLYFQGHTYVIRRGVLDFVNPQRLDPLFDIEAETRVRSYQVTLRVSGTLERVYAHAHLGSPALLAADPEPARRAGGERGGEPHADPGAPGPGAARGDRRRHARRGPHLGVDGPRARGGAALRPQPLLDRPFAAAGRRAPPTARVTVGKRVTPDLNVVYSQDLRGTEERILARRVHPLRPLLAAAHTDGPRHGQDRHREGWAFDVRIRQSPLMLALALAAGGRGRGHRRRPASSCAPVRVERDRERLLPFVAMAPGQPFDPDRGPPLGRAALRDRRLRGRARRVVRDPARPRRRRGVPAASWRRCSRRCEIEGDRVLSAGAARRDRAPAPAGAAVAGAPRARRARRGARALAQRGYLEALVRRRRCATRRGPVLVFAIHAGPRVRVSSIDLECSDAALRAQLAGLDPPRTRASPTSSAKAEAARDAMRKRLAESGYWHAGGHARRDLRSRARAACGSSFRAVPGPRTSFETRGAAAAGAAREPGAPDPARGRGVERQPGSRRASWSRPAARGGPSRRERHARAETPAPTRWWSTT